jgi:NSS family neurotransmitter:Na+ symporter
MATAGFAIGLGNIWRFPYLTGTNGGGAFLLGYVLFSILIGIPLLSAEISMGRKAQLTPLAAMTSLTGSAWSPWNLIAWLGMAAAVLIQSYYLMLIGWIIGYFRMIVTGQLATVPPDRLGATYETFIGTPGPVIVYTMLVIVLLALIARRGLRRGLERVGIYAMPVLFVLLLLLAIRSLTFPGSWKGLVWYLTPDFSAINGRILLEALGQAFYSIGIGMATAFGLGSYLHREDSDVPGNAALVVACDTFVAFLAGLVIFPALFAFGLEPDTGPGLLFVTMTNMFARMPAGSVFGGAFFFLLILAAITSAAALFEVLTTMLTDLTRLRRRTATWLLAGMFGLLSTPVILSLAPGSSLRVLGMNLFDFADAASGRYLLPLGGLMLALYVAFVWGFDRFRDETNVGAGRVRVTAAWRPMMVFFIPVAVAFVLLAGAGIL